MKPTFALDLTRDVVGLLHRTPKGWLSIGDAPFDAPDLDEALDYLRKTALGLSPMGMATKIVLPNSQILYTEVHAPGPSRDDKRRQIATALEGQTPYDVTDLVFDWSGKGATVKVAVVARETLEEAERFAAGHRLNPVSFVAIPDDGTFVGEPFFGPTEAAATILAEGETVEKDREPVAILHRELPPAEPQPAELPPETPAQPAEAAPETEPAATAAESKAEDPEAEEPLPGLEEALNGDLPDGTDTVAADHPEPQPTEPSLPEVEEVEDDLPGGGLVQAPPAVVPPVPAAADAAEVAPAEDVAVDVPAEETPAVEVAAEEVAEAPFAHVTDTVAFPDDDVTPAPISAVRVTADALDDDLPPAPPSAAMVAFASRRATAPAGAPLGAPPRAAD
jgi:hypothetical protein